MNNMIRYFESEDAICTLSINDKNPIIPPVKSTVYLYDEEYIVQDVMYCVDDSGTMVDVVLERVENNE